MQMKAFTITAALAARTTSVVAYPAADFFHVSDFRSYCTKSIPPQCTYLFSLSYNSVSGANCTIQDTATDYVQCGISIPEQAYYAYVQKSPDEDGPDNLQAKFRQTLADGSTSTQFGNATLPQPSPDFSFPVVAGTITQSSSDE